MKKLLLLSLLFCSPVFAGWTEEGGSGGTISNWTIGVLTVTSSATIGGVYIVNGLVDGIDVSAIATSTININGQLYQIGKSTSNLQTQLYIVGRDTQTIQSLLTTIRANVQSDTTTLRSDLITWNYLIGRDTATVVTNLNTWNYLIGRDTATIRSDLITWNYLIGRDTATIASLLNSVRANVQTDTTTLRNDLNSWNYAIGRDTGTTIAYVKQEDYKLGISTGLIQGDLATEVNDRKNGDYALGRDTGTIRYDLDTLSVSSGVLLSYVKQEDYKIGIQTGTIQSQVNILKTSSTINQQNISLLGSSVTINQIAITNLQVNSTNYLAVDGSGNMWGILQLWNSVNNNTPATTWSMNGATLSDINVINMYSLGASQINWADASQSTSAARYDPGARISITNLQTKGTDYVLKSGDTMTGLLTANGGISVSNTVLTANAGINSYGLSLYGATNSIYTNLIPGDGNNWMYGADGYGFTIYDAVSGFKERMTISPAGLVNVWQDFSVGVSTLVVHDGHIYAGATSSITTGGNVSGLNGIFDTTVSKTITVTSSASVMGSLACQNVIILGTSSIVMGYEPNVYGNHTGGIAIGSNCYNNYSSGIGIGIGSYANYASGIGIGAACSNNFTNGIGIGNACSGNNGYGTGIGYACLGNTTWGVAVGANNRNNSNFGIAIGQNNWNVKAHGIVIGNSCFAASSSTAIGSWAIATGTQSIAIGGNAKASGYRSIALGYNSTCDIDNTIMLSRQYQVMASTVTLTGAFKPASMSTAEMLAYTPASAGEIWLNSTTFDLYVSTGATQYGMKKYAVTAP